MYQVEVLAVFLLSIVAKGDITDSFMTAVLVFWGIFSLVLKPVCVGVVVSTANVCVCVSLLLFIADTV